jgi:tetratricopeptide (TPR) repeat protein
VRRFVCSVLGMASLLLMPTGWAEVSAGMEPYNKGVELFQIAQIQLEKGNRNGQQQLLKKAIEQFKKALKADPTLVEAQSNIGFAELTLRRYDAALTAFAKALTINPKHLNTLNGMATTLALDGKTEESLALFGRLLTLAPDQAQYYFNQGSILQKAGRLEEARKAYEQAVHLDPKEQRALFNLGTVAETQGQPELARSYYEKAKAVAIDSPIGLEALRRLEANTSPANP